MISHKNTIFSICRIGIHNENLVRIIIIQDVLIGVFNCCNCGNKTERVIPCNGYEYSS